MFDRLGAKSILCEIVDTTSVARLSDLKSQLTGRLGVQIRDDLATVEMASSILGIADLPRSRYRAIADVLRSKVEKTVHTLTECRHYLDLNSGLDGLERFPVDPRPLLLEAVERTRIQAAQEGLTIEIKEPKFVSYVLASADKLRQILLSILGLLCQDAADNSTVLVRVTEDVDVVAFDFSNMGFGIPNELLHEYLHGEEALASADFQNLQAAVRWIEAWGGHLEAVSGVGVGMHFTVHLAKFI
jgi:histidine kinase